MRLIATQGDVYGPSAGLAKQQSYMATGDAPQASNAIPTSAKVPMTQVFTGLQNTVMENPLGWLLGLIALVFVWKLVEEKASGHESFHEIKLGAGNVIKIGTLAFIFAIVLKFLTRRYLVPGLSPLTAYVYGA